MAIACTSTISITHSLYKELTHFFPKIVSSVSQLAILFSLSFSKPKNITHKVTFANHMQEIPVPKELRNFPPAFLDSTV